MARATECREGRFGDSAVWVNLGRKALGRECGRLSQKDRKIAKRTQRFLATVHADVVDRQMFGSMERHFVAWVRPPSGWVRFGSMWRCVRILKLRSGEILCKSVLGAVTRLLARESIT